MSSNNDGHDHSKHQFTKYSQYVKVYSPNSVEIPDPKIKKSKIDKQNKEKDYEHAHRDLAVTSSIALALMASILIILYFSLEGLSIENHNKNMIWTISSIGFITFFGMLVVSSHHSIMKEDSKGTMRKALASSFVVVYLIVFALIIFNGIDITEIAGIHSEDENTQLTSSKILDHLTKIIMVILGFYFGTKGVKEIAEVVKKDYRNEGKPKKMTHPKLININFMINLKNNV